MKKLGFGLMRMPLLNSSDSTSVDVEQVKKMVDMFIERGFTYFDTAWMYHDYESENVVKAALTSRHKRDSFTLTTKLHSGYFETLEDREKIFNKQLEKTGVEYFDYYLLHAIDSTTFDKYEKFDCFNWLADKKEKGLIRHMGFSFHDSAEMLDKILTKYPQMEFVQLQINYLDWESEWVQSRACYETARKYGKPVIIMEPVKGGTLAKLPEAAETLFRNYAPDCTPASWALRFAATLPGVMMVLSGMSDLTQLDENTRLFDSFEPMTDEERKICFMAAEIINKKITVPCTACSYCTEGCPMNIAIPQYFSMYNEDMREHLDEKGWTVNFSNYDVVSSKHGKAMDCIECGQCEGACPQHLPIIKYLKDVSKHFDHEH